MLDWLCKVISIKSKVRFDDQKTLQKHCDLRGLEILVVADILEAELPEARDGLSSCRLWNGVMEAEEQLVKRAVLDRT